MRKNLGWIRSGVSKIVNFNEDQPDQDFDGSDDDAYRDIDFAINEAYEGAVEDILAEGDPELMEGFCDDLWPANEQTHKIPSFLEQDMITRIDNITARNPGESVLLYPRGFNYEPTNFFVDRNTLQWGTSGPPADTTYRYFYSMYAKEMHKAVDEPILVPRRYRKLLQWDAAINLRTMAEDEAPPRWMQHREKIWERMILAASKGRPTIGNKSRIQVLNQEADFF